MNLVSQILMISVLYNIFLTNNTLAAGNTDSTNNIIKTETAKADIPFAKWNAQMLIGNGFNYDRGVGFGVRGNFEFKNIVFTGISVFYHMGFPRSVAKDGYGPSTLIGFELGKRIDISLMKIEVSFSAGQSTYEEAPSRTVHFAQGTVAKFYFSPGVGTLFQTETGSVGIHLRYVIVERFNMLGVYGSIGI